MTERLKIHDRIRGRVADHVSGQLDLIIGLIESIADHFGYRFCSRCLTLMERAGSDLDEISNCVKGSKNAHSE